MALTPHLLGFRPRNEIVIVTLAMESQRGTGPIVRCDLADLAEYADLSYVAMQLVLDYKITGLAIDWYGADLAQMCDGSDIAYHIDAAARQVQAYLAQRHQLNGRGYVCAGGTDYRQAVNFAEFTELVEPSFAAAQEAGIVVPYQKLVERPMNAELVFSGSAPLDCEPAELELRVPAAIRAAAVTSYRQCIAGTEFRPKVLWKNILAKLAAGAEGTELGLASDSIKLGRLNAALKDISLRDSILVFAINPQMPVSEICHPDIAAAQLKVASQLPVNKQRITKVIDVLEVLAAYSADEDPSAYAALAYLWWWAGKSDLAEKYAAQALKSDPQYSLARLVERAVTAQLPPPWSQQEKETSHSG